jgi:hypothetical protein
MNHIEVSSVPAKTKDEHRDETESEVWKLNEADSENYHSGEVQQI